MQPAMWRSSLEVALHTRGEGMEGSRACLLCVSLVARSLRVHVAVGANVCV